MFTEDDLLDIHFGIHGDGRAIQTRFGFVPIENRPVKYGGVVRCVTINKYDFMEQNIKEKNEWAQKSKEGHDITWITNLDPPGQIFDGEIKSSCLSIIRRDPPEQPQPVPKKQRIDVYLTGDMSSQKTLSPSQSQENEAHSPVKVTPVSNGVLSKIDSPEQISHRKIVKAKKKTPNKDVENKDATEGGTIFLDEGNHTVRRSTRLKSKILKKGPSLMSLETDLDAYKNNDESHEETANLFSSKTLQQSTLIDVDIMQKSQDNSANSSQVLYYEDSADPMISSQEAHPPPKRKLTRKFSTFAATPMVDIDSSTGTGLPPNLTPMDIEQNSFANGSTVTKSVIMKTLVSPAKEAKNNRGGNNNNNNNNGSSKHNATDTIIANLIGENGSLLNPDQNQGAAARFDTKLRTVRRSTFEIDFHELRVGKKIGAGAFGEVLKGTYRRVPVAIKILASQDNEAQKMFMKEVILLCKVQHPNVVKCFGACLKPPKLCFVMEFMPQSLGDFIEKHKDHMPLKELVTIAYYIAEGIDFLHSCKIIHRDLKPENILLDDNLTPKIADFGVSREKIQTAVMTKVGTPSYCAPEILNNEMYSEKADIYSYGMLLYAMVTGHAPFTNMNLTPLQIMMKAAVLHERPPIPSTCPTALAEIINDCWQHDSKARPSAKEVMERLKAHFGKH